LVEDYDFKKENIAGIYITLNEDSFEKGTTISFKINGNGFDDFMNEDYEINIEDCDTSDYKTLDYVDYTSVNISETGMLRPIYYSACSLSQPGSYNLNISFSDRNITFENAIYISDELPDFTSVKNTSRFMCNLNRIQECCGDTYEGCSNFDNWAHTLRDDYNINSRLSKTTQPNTIIYDKEYNLTKSEANSLGDENAILILRDCDVGCTGIAGLFKGYVNMKQSNELLNNLQRNNTQGYNYIEMDFYSVKDIANFSLKISDLCEVNLTNYDFVPSRWNHLKFDISSCSNNIDYLKFNISAEDRTFGMNDPFKNSVANFNSIYGIDRVYLSNGTADYLFCTTDGTWQSDFDSDEFACEKLSAGFWTGTRCCGDEFGEYYADENGKRGACYNGISIKNNERITDVYMSSKISAGADLQGYNNLTRNQTLVYNGEYYICANSTTYNEIYNSLNALSSNQIINNTNIHRVWNIGNNATMLINSSEKVNSNIKYYCSPNHGWVNDNAIDKSYTIPALQRTYFSNISKNIDGTLETIYVVNFDGVRNISSLGGYISESCPVNWCWNGLKCIENQRDEPVDWMRLANGTSNTSIDKYYRCIDGNWTETPELKKTWQTNNKKAQDYSSDDEETKNNAYRYYDTFPEGKTTGFCPRETDCLVNPSARYNLTFDNLNDQEFLNEYVISESSSELYKFTEYDELQCIPQDYYVGNYYCDNGNWISRISIMAQNLTNFVEDEDYTIYCDNFANVFNLQSPTSLELFDEHYNNLGCVLRIYETSENDTFIYAVQMNTNNVDGISMDDFIVPSRYENYGASKFHFDEKTGILFFSKDGKILTPSSSSGTGILEGLWNFIKNIFIDASDANTDFDTISEDAKSDFYIYSKLYILNSTDYQAFGISGYNLGTSPEILTKFYYLDDDDMIDNLTKQFRNMTEFEVLKDGVNKLDLFEVEDLNISDNILFDENGELSYHSTVKLFNINHSINSIFNPGNTFYEDEINNEKEQIFWETLVDDFLSQIRISSE